MNIDSYISGGGGSGSVTSLALPKATGMSVGAMTPVGFDPVTKTITDNGSIECYHRGANFSSVTDNAATQPMLLSDGNTLQFYSNGTSSIIGSLSNREGTKFKNLGGSSFNYQNMFPSVTKMSEDFFFVSGRGYSAHSSNQSNSQTFRAVRYNPDSQTLTWSTNYIQRSHNYYNNSRQDEAIVKTSETSVLHFLQSQSSNMMNINEVIYTPSTNTISNTQKVANLTRQYSNTMLTRRGSDNNLETNGYAIKIGNQVIFQTGRFTKDGLLVIALDPTTGRYVSHESIAHGSVFASGEPLPSGGGILYDEENDKVLFPFMNQFRLSIGEWDASAKHFKNVKTNIYVNGHYVRGRGTSTELVHKGIFYGFSPSMYSSAESTLVAYKMDYENGKTELLAKKLVTQETQINKGFVIQEDRVLMYTASCSRTGTGGGGTLRDFWRGIQPTVGVTTKAATNSDTEVEVVLTERHYKSESENLSIGDRVSYEENNHFVAVSKDTLVTTRPKTILQGTSIQRHNYDSSALPARLREFTEVTEIHRSTNIFPEGVIHRVTGKGQLHLYFQISNQEHRITLLSPSMGGSISYNNGSGSAVEINHAQDDVSYIICNCSADRYVLYSKPYGTMNIEYHGGSLFEE